MRACACTHTQTHKHTETHFFVCLVAFSLPPNPDFFFFPDTAFPSLYNLFHPTIPRSLLFAQFFLPEIYSSSFNLHVAGQMSKNWKREEKKRKKERKGKKKTQQYTKPFPSTKTREKPGREDEIPGIRCVLSHIFGPCKNLLGNDGSSRWPFHSSAGHLRSQGGYWRRQDAPPPAKSHRGNTSRGGDPSLQFLLSGRKETQQACSLQILRWDPPKVLNQPEDIARQR